MALPKAVGTGADREDINSRVAHNEVEDPSENTSLLGAGDSRNDQSLVRVGSWDGLSDFKSEPWWRTPSVYWLLVPYAIFTLAFGGMLVPKLNLILSLVCKQYFADRNIADPTQPLVPVLLGGDNPQCRIPEVQSNVATFMLVMNFVTGLLSAITAPKLGHLSDRYGRTRLLALSSLGGLCGELVTLLAAKFPQTIDYRWLILGSFFDGITGSFTAGLLLTQSYATDCTPPSNRAVRMGYLHACLFTGLAFGPLVAGYFVKWTGSLISIFYVVVVCHACFILFMAFVVPNSLSERRRLAAQEKHAKEEDAKAEAIGSWLSSIQSFNIFEPLRILWPTAPGTSFRVRLNLLTLALSDMIIMGASISAGAIVILYSEYTWEWGNLESSLFVSALSLVRVVVLLVIFPILNYFGRTRPARQRRARGDIVADKNSGADHLDVWVIRIAFLSEVIGYTGYLLSRDQRMFVASGMTTAIGGLGSATMGAVVTKLIPSDKVGQVLGAIGMLHALARVVGPVVFNGIYAATVGTFPQAFFLVLGCLFAFGFLGSFVLKTGIHWEGMEDDETEPLHGDNEPTTPYDPRRPLDQDEAATLL
jgi:MFS family permease